MAADDFLNDPQDQGYPSGLDTSSMSGNRPASGARRATPGEVLSTGFQGAENAGDFLGLDTEFTGSQDPNQAYGTGPLDLVSPPGTYSGDSDYAQSLAPAPMPASDPVQDFAQAPSAFEFGEDLGSEDGGDEGLLGEAAPSKKPLYVGALLVAALTTTGVMYGPGLYSRFFPASTEIARSSPSSTGTNHPTPVEAQPVTKATEQPLTIDPEVAVEPPTQLPAPTHSEGDSKEPDTALAGLKPVRLEPARPGVTPPAPVSTNPATSGAVATSNPLARPQPTSFPNLAGSEFEWASKDQLELIWRGNEVPLEALSAPAKTIMPRVGNVRVFTLAGDVFEGRLYAVGQNRVWIDTQPGRIGLDGSKVQRIDLLPEAPAGNLTSASDLHVAGSRRVRVRVPGGMLYGSVLKVEDDDVTLALDSGGRVRVKADDVQNLGSGRAVVVRK